MKAPQFGIMRAPNPRRRAPTVQTGEPLIIRASVKLRSGKPINNAHNRAVLWAADPRCHWCKLETVIAPVGTKTLSHYHATLDHVFGEKSERRDVIVLACHGCNSKRGYQEAPRRRKPDPERRAETLRLAGYTDVHHKRASQP